MSKRVPWTSIEALKSIEPYARTVEHKVALALDAAGGEATRDDIERLTGLSHQTVTSRIWFMLADGALKEIPHFSYTRTGRRAILLRFGDRVRVT